MLPVMQQKRRDECSMFAHDIAKREKASLSRTDSTMEKNSIKDHHVCACLVAPCARWTILGMSDGSLWSADGQVSRPMGSHSPIMNVKDSFTVAWSHGTVAAVSPMVSITKDECRKGSRIEEWWTYSGSPSWYCLGRSPSWVALLSIELGNE